MNWARGAPWKEKAFKWLEQAYVERNSWLPELKADPAWDNLRSDARFQALLQRVNLIAQ